MWRYISPGTVFTTSFAADTTVKTGLIFKSIKKRGAGLANIDAALDSLHDNFRPKTDPQGTAGHFILVLRQAKAWLRKMDTKKQKNAKESKGRLQKRQAIELLANESLDMLVYCSPTLAKALASFNANKGQAPGFTMKGLSRGYEHERNIYLKNNKTGLSSKSGSGVHTFYDDVEQHKNNPDPSKGGLFGKAETKALSSGAKSALRKINRGKLDFYALNEADFIAIGELAKAKMIAAEVKFFDKLERLKMLITVSGGSLMKADGKPCATCALTKTPPDKNIALFDQYMWAMDGHGNLFGSANQTERSKFFNHSSFMAGKAVACAGMFATSPTGKLLMINSSSGHYKPTRQNLFEAVSFLDQEGADLSGCLVYCQAHENGQPYIYYFTAERFLSGPQAQPNSKEPGEIK